MPQASVETAKRFVELFGTEDDQVALHYLATKGLRDKSGMFEYTAEQWADPKVQAALQYLAEEWDYAYQEKSND